MTVSNDGFVVLAIELVKLSADWRLRMHSTEIWFYDSDVKLQALRGRQRENLRKILTRR